MNDSNPPRPANFLPGYDKEDPYKGEKIASYPDWWRENIKIFVKLNMRPYRPSRFSNGDLLPPRIGKLEKELGINVRFRAINPHENDEWDVLVDEKLILTVNKQRSGKGYTVYQISSNEFEAQIRKAVIT